MAHSRDDQVYTLSNDIESQIRKLVLTIKTLMPGSRGGWVPWRKAAKEQEGSELFEPQLSGLAQLPKWKHLFIATGNVVRLSDEGILFANGQQAESLTEVQRIADAVRRYAARLDRIWLKVEHISKVARVGNKGSSSESVGEIVWTSIHLTPVGF
jgi:hypothetical protein